MRTKGFRAAIVVPLIVVPIFSGTRVSEPLGIDLIPLDRFAEALLKAEQRAPAEFAPNFRAIKRVATIMARAILNVLNQ